MPHMTSTETWLLADLVDEPAPPGLSCGLDELDRFTGGIQPGAVWTLVTSTGQGASRFAIQAAVSAAKSAQVRLVNGHHAPHPLTRRVEDAAVALRLSAVPGARQRLYLAASIDLPRWEPTSDQWHRDRGWLAGDDALVVIDTLDEMFHLLSWPPTVEHRLRHLRDIRELAREHSTALLLTARVSPTDTVTALETEWRKHWAYEMFADISDVALKATPPTNSLAQLHAYVRGSGYWRADIAAIAGAPGRFHPIRAINPEPHLPC